MGAVGFVELVGHAARAGYAPQCVDHAVADGCANREYRCHREGEQPAGPRVLACAPALDVAERLGAG